MAVILEGGCRVSEMREGKPLTEGTLRIWNRIGRATGAQAISLRIMEFAPGLSPGIRNDEFDEILYVLDESGSARTSDSEGVRDSSQGRARSSKTPLDERVVFNPYPEGVRRTSQQ